jgi:O-antigen ligase
LNNPSPPIHARSLARAALWLEPLILIAAIYFFWFPSNYPYSLAEPIDRFEYRWLLALIVPLIGVRLLLYRRPWTATPLDAWLIALIGIGLFNTEFAPYDTRGAFMLLRPLLGLALVIGTVELARLSNGMTLPATLILILALLIGVLALFATRWDAKSDELYDLARSLPRFELPPFASGGFNPNEIAGAIAWVLPPAAALSFYPFARRWRALNVLAAIAFTLLATALILGQSRFAIAGVLLALLAVAIWVVPRGWPRYAALLAWVAVVALEAALTLNLFDVTRSAGAGSAAVGLSGRDESSFTRRFDIWESGLAIVRDHPLTGAGINNFRAGPVRADYPVAPWDMPVGATEPQPGYQTRILPHAHNETVQIAADLGLPGLIVYIGWHLTLLYMMWVCWRRGDRGAQIVALAVTGGVMAHAVFGLGDAIPLWDRFIFVYWALLGLGAAQYALVRGQIASGRSPLPSPHDAEDVQAHVYTE